MSSFLITKRYSSIFDQALFCQVVFAVDYECKLLQFTNEAIKSKIHQKWTLLPKKRYRFPNAWYVVILFCAKVEQSPRHKRVPIVPLECVAKFTNLFFEAGKAPEAT